MLTAGWATPLELTKDEAKQRAYEGCTVPADIPAELNSMDRYEDAFSERLADIRARLAALQPARDFSYVQPNDLDGIRAQRPDGPRQLPMNLSDQALLDKFHGAWTGRSVGCALGKPVELLGMMGHEDLNGRGGIKRYLQARNDWPLRQYFSEAAVPGETINIRCPASCRENIAYMEPDDDIHYTLIGLKVLEQFGRNFRWQDVADTWNQSLPYAAICTAETQAILNYNMRTPHIALRQGHDFCTAEFTRTHNNPYREWIGAQIRADGWAYCCAGNPELAAEFAWRDAHWTHSANGIYGAMFMAAMIAAAFVEADPLRLVEIGLSEIPYNCRLAEALREALGWAETCNDFESFMDIADNKYADMSPVHTVNNAVIVAMSLFYGAMNPDKTIAISVMAGKDTDCNGASVGSVVGVVAGKRGFGGTLQQGLSDTIKPLVFGFQEITMSELAERTLAVHHTLRQG